MEKINKLCKSCGENSLHNIDKDICTTCDYFEQKKKIPLSCFEHTRNILETQFKEYFLGYNTIKGETLHVKNTLPLGSFSIEQKAMIQVFSPGKEFKKREESYSHEEADNKQGFTKSFSYKDVLVIPWTCEGSSHVYYFYA